MQNKRLLLPALTGALLSLAAGSANATSVSLGTSSTAFTVGSQVIFDIDVNFSDLPILGGGLDVIYGGFTDGSQLSFLSYTPSTTFGLDPAFSRAPDAQSGKLNGIGFGNFSGLSGVGSIGRITFLLNSAGTYSLNLGINTGDVGGFYDTNSNALAGLSLTGIHFTVSDPAAVPVPGSLSLLAGALAGLLGLASRRKAIA